MFFKRGKWEMSVKEMRRALKTNDRFVLTTLRRMDRQIASING